MNYEPLYGSDNRSVLSALNIRSKFIELIVLSEFLIFSIDLFKI